MLQIEKNSESCEIYHTPYITKRYKYQYSKIFFLLFETVFTLRKNKNKIEKYKCLIV